MFTNWELGEWGDGTIRLYFEDSIHGDDVSIVLREDGTAVRTHHHLEGDGEFEPIDLVQFLREFAQQTDEAPL